jgi:hypothetical protein
MKTRLVYLIALLPSLAAAQNPEEVAVRQAATGFVKALAAGDSTAALALLHPDVVIFEAGNWESLDDYRKGHLRADMRACRA